MPHFLSSSRVKCTMLAVLCGKVGKQRTPPGPMPESQRLWPSFPFPELISSGRMLVSWAKLAAIKSCQKSRNVPDTLSRCLNCTQRGSQSCGHKQKPNILTP
ncbi:hypothetical protein DAI22_08g173700 [Oryza sativa Japonica Group]|nr:hypothetical protein DAI22_08g173700 [Oryza sativa Japonica Group]